MLSTNYIIYEVNLALGLLKIAIRAKEEKDIDNLIRATHRCLDTAKENIIKQTGGVDDE